MTKNELAKSVAAFRDDINRRKGQRETLLTVMKQKETKAASLKEEVEVLRQVARLYALAGEYARRESKDTMERLVTNALSMVFQSDLEFQIEMEERGDRPEAEFYVTSTYGGTQVIKNEPREARGGGVVDVISLALRIALMETIRPRLGGPLILDEPGKHVSEEYARQVADFLNAVCQSFGRQVILVTHNQHLTDAGAVTYQVEIKNGESQVSLRFRQE
ncbi:MAG: ATP-binding protein [Candidatus Saccharibacteria bacterium]